MLRNGDTVKANAWITDSLAWKNIYLEEYGLATFSPNPYVVESARATVGIYKYEQPKKTIRFVLHSPASGTDTLYAAVARPAAGHINGKSFMTKTPFSCHLLK